MHSSLRTLALFAALLVAGALPHSAHAGSHSSEVALAEAEGAVLGDWYMAEKEVTIHIYKTAAGYQGKTTAAPKPDMVGKWILRNMVFSEDKSTYAGKLVTPDGDEISATLRLTGANSLELKGRKLVFTKTMNLTRK
jgi:hypothetical protein